MSNYRIFDLVQADGFASTVHVWAASAPKAVIQLAHGMGEYARRYEYAIGKLNEAGYTVYANDHRGHGQSALDDGSQGNFGAGGFDLLVSDLVAITAQLRRNNAELPLFLLGHSMGSFASQLYLLENSEAIDGVILSGSTALDIMAAEFAKVELVDGEFPNVLNAPFEPSRTDFDWLSRDESQVDAYIASPLCGFAVAPESFGSILACGPRTADVAALGQIRKDLPVYIFSGDKDPVGGNTELLKVLAQRYRDAGLSDVTEKYYADARHEMFNETNRDEAIADVVAWLDRRLSAAC